MIANPNSAFDCFSLSANRMWGEGRGEVGSPHKLLLRVFLFAYFAYFAVQSAAAETFAVLKPAAFAHHIEHFNASDDESIPTTISNKKSWAWLQDNIPLFECPDRDVEEIYYFRWWSFRKHIKQTTKGYVITEFLPPVSHAGAFNTISCAAGFHLAEGRWLRDDKYINDYTRFWLRGNNGKPQPHFHKFSSWFAAAAWDRYLVNRDKKFLVRFSPDLVADYRAWETERQLPNGLFWQHDVKDAMEESISGSRTAKNIRPTINSYMFGNARAIAEVSRLANKPKITAEFITKATELKRLTQKNLWDTNANFFKVLVATTNSSISLAPSDGERAEERGYRLADVREILGYIPWMFGIADISHSAAWLQLTDPQGFSAPFGLTTAERRHTEFRNRGVGTCEWDGAIWPFATSQTLVALANALRSDSLGPSEGTMAGVRGDPAINHQLSTINYFDTFLTYTHSQRANGQPFIGEYLDETTGDWINRANRSAHYNHSTYADLIITGVIGLIPHADNIVEISPLLPPNTWDWFCLDGVKYHGHMLTVIWDKDGTRYGRGAGLRVLANGKLIAQSEKLERITGRFP